MSSATVEISILNRTDVNDFIICKIASALVFVRVNEINFFAVFREPCLCRQKHGRPVIQQSRFFCTLRPCTSPLWFDPVHRKIWQLFSSLSYKVSFILVQLLWRLVQLHTDIYYFIIMYRCICFMSSKVFVLNVFTS